MKPGTPVRGELSDAAIVSRSWGMALATLVSRITGFIRIVLLAAILGAALSSAFTVANQLPNMIAALVLEATFTAVFVPMLARAERDDPDGGSDFIRRLVTLATMVLVIATIISVAAAPVLVRLMLGGDPQVNKQLTTAFAYLLLPQVVFYGLTAVFMAILTNRNIFSAPAWAPVVNNIIAIATLGIYVVVPGELSLDPVQMGNTKLLVLGVGTTLGVIAQAVVLYVAIRAERIDLRPLWGIDARLKRFAATALAMVLYVLISQIGFVVSNQIASAAAASGPAIYNYTWTVLMLPAGMIGVTVLTVVMPRLSRNAAANNISAICADMSLATRITMVTLIPIVAVMTIGGPAIGSILFSYGNFGAVDAGYLGRAITLSAFTLLPYTVMLLQLRVFYAREQPWIPIVIIVAVTCTKIVASVLAPYLTNDAQLVAGYLGLANGLGFVVGAIVGYVLLHRTVQPRDGQLLDPEVIRTIVVCIGAALLAAVVAHSVDRVSGLSHLTVQAGSAGSLLRLSVLAGIMLPIMAAVLLAARVPDAQAAARAVIHRLRPNYRPNYPYPQQRNSATPVAESQESQIPKGLGLSDHTPDNITADSAYPDSGEPTQLDLPTTAITTAHQATAEDFHPDIAAKAGNQLIPGASIGDGRYRLLASHGGLATLRFWQALDTALDRQVAITFIDPDGVLPDEQVQHIVAGTHALSAIDTIGVARVLDIVNTAVGMVVICEWIRGGSLQEVANTSPSPIGSARAVQSLAKAASAAHRAGIALSIDHPSRVRISIEGDVVLAFPAPLPQSTVDDDIRGIGATLYALLVNRWPLPETGASSGFPPAETDAAGIVLEPSIVDRAIPFQISAAAARSVQTGGGIRSATTLVNLLQQATAAADRTQFIPATTPPTEVPVTAPATSRVVHIGARRRNILIGTGIGITIFAVVLMMLASFLKGIFSDVGDGFAREKLGLNPSISNSEPGTSGGAITPIAVTVFSPDGGADNPDLADQALTDNLGDGWPTDTYTDPNPFPNFKNGVGLMLQLPQPVVLENVQLTVPSSGTSIEIRSATTMNPATVTDTTALTPPVSLQPGLNTIAVDNAEPTSYVLVWISTLGITDDENRTEISGLRLNAT